MATAPQEDRHILVRDFARDTDIDDFVSFYNLAHSRYPKHRQMTPDIAKQYLFGNAEFDGGSNPLATIESAIIGAARCDIRAPGKASVSILVSPDHVGQRIEQALLDRLGGYLITNRIHEVNAIVPSNFTHLTSFFESNGFKHTKSGCCLIADPKKVSTREVRYPREYLPAEAHTGMDYTQISDLLQSSFLPSDGPEVIASQFLSIVKQPFFDPSGVLLLRHKETVIGACVNLVHPAIPDTGFVNWLAIHPDHRNRGLGKGLLTTSLAWFNGKRIKSVELNVNVANTSALNLYIGCGFEISYEEKIFEKSI